MTEKELAIKWFEFEGMPVNESDASLYVCVKESQDLQVSTNEEIKDNEKILGNSQ